MSSHLGEKKSRPDCVTEVEKLFTSIEHAGMRSLCSMKIFKAC